MWNLDNDGSVLDATGKVVVFSPRRFVSDICAGDCCFLCGAGPQDKPFNNALVLPEWLLSRYHLSANSVRAADGSTVRHDRHSVPTCRDCNKLINDEIERPVSEVVRRGGNAINDHIQKDGLGRFYIWMALIFLKTHLKDNLARYRLDPGPGEEKRPDAHEWSKLHLVHSIVRGFFLGVEINEDATGSFLTMPANGAGVAGPFDYADLFAPQTMMIRLDNTALMTVFDDTGAALTCLSPKLEKCTGLLSDLQLREVMAELAYLNTRLKTRPEFKTSTDLELEKLRLVATRPQLELRDSDLLLRGKLLRSALGNKLAQVTMAGHTNEEVSAAADAGTLTFLFDGEGRFIADAPLPA